MNCEKFKNMIAEYISGELEDKDRIELTSHLEHCADCRKELDIETEILNSLSENIYNIPEGLNEAVLSKLNERKHPFRINFMRYAIAASFFFLVIMSYFMFDPAVEKPAVAATDTNAYYNEYVLGSEYDELISYNAVLYDEDKWTSEDTDIFDSESDIINDLLTLEELESYDIYLTSL
jgi:predicted anti-sigma-YlaC factor YlaD